MKKKTISLSRRCPRLGGPVSFQYCRSCEIDKAPCFKIIDCWWETFDIQQYLKDTLPQDQYDRLTSTKPKEKISSIIELVELLEKNKKPD